MLGDAKTPKDPRCLTNGDEPRTFKTARLAAAPMSGAAGVQDFRRSRVRSDWPSSLHGSCGSRFVRMPDGSGSFGVTGRSSALPGSSRCARPFLDRRIPGFLGVLGFIRAVRRRSGSFGFRHIRTSGAPHAAPIGTAGLRPSGRSVRTPKLRNDMFLRISGSFVLLPCSGSCGALAECRRDLVRGSTRDWEF